MKKWTHKIIGLSLMSSLMVMPFHGIAQESEAPVLKACNSLNPNFYVEDGDKIITNKDWKVEGALSSTGYRARFENAQTAYHNHMECLFNFAENTIYKTGAAREDGILQANTPNTRIIDWMVPNEACLSPVEIKTIIETTSPDQMLTAVLTAHQNYEKYLNELFKAYSNNPTEENAQGNSARGADLLIKVANNLSTFDKEKQMEIDGSLVGIDLMFTYIKELRQAFIMHVHFQCTLKYLEKYRRELEKLRNLITPLPDQLRDASVTK